MRLKLKLFLLQLILPCSVFAQQFIEGGRKELPPQALYTAGISSSVMSLNGSWEINMTPPANFWTKERSADNWKKILVPGEPAMQGFKVETDKSFAYRKKFMIPKDANGKTLFVRFNGVYSYARVWVNGKFIREHFGGFTAWDCDISAYVKAGEQALLYVEVTDRADDISFASGYAHHPIGGILRNVKLIILPKTYIKRLYVNASLTSDFKQGTMNFNIALNKVHAGSVIKYVLRSPEGKVVKTEINSFQGTDPVIEKTNIPRVETWTAENPQLYQLEVSLIEQGKVQQVVKQSIGFRKVEINGEKELLVNGMPVKLRGACRHDMNPTLGRSTNRAQDSLDVVLAKEGNLNFIRTSHYPPSQDFLEFCDRYGIYVEEETAICFVGADRGGVYNKFATTQDDSAFNSRYLGQLSEMVDHDRNHAAIIIWSIGNESEYGSNFQREYDFIKTIDHSRPVSWSWPGTAISAGKRCFDIAIGHYPNYDGKGSDMGGIDKNMVNSDYPLLSDEWAHIPCYNIDLIKYDPNINDYWGRSLDMMWANRFDVKGNIGGAIWGMIDETFCLPDTVTGYGPWGFVDVWRRKKPEFWNVKKAYSPVRVLKTDFAGNKQGDVVQIPVKNRFDHTILSDVACIVIIKGKKTPLRLPHLLPHEQGAIKFKIPDNSQQTALLQFNDKGGNLIDEEKISWGTARSEKPKTDNKEWAITETATETLLQSGKVSISINKNTGLITQASVAGQLMLTGGPIFTVNRPKNGNVLKNTPTMFSGNFVAKSTTIKLTDKKEVTIKSEGSVDQYPVTLNYSLFPSGEIVIKYQADSIPKQTWDIGLRFPLSSKINTVSWDRKGYWTTYPSDHLSALRGKAEKNNDAIENYRERPGYKIPQSATDFYLYQTTDTKKASTFGTEVYRAKKENIFSYSVSQLSSPAKLTVLSDGSQAAKMNTYANGEQDLLVSDKWDYWSISWGNYQGEINRSAKVSGTIRLSME